MVRGVLVAWLAGGVLVAGGRDLKAFFQERCAICHGSDGSGKGAGGIRLGGRNLRDDRWLAKEAEAGLAASILNGKGAMPGFRRQLTDGEAHQLAMEILRKAESGKVVSRERELAR